MHGGERAIIERYADGLAARLRGPGRVRRDLVAEARDSLLDATEAHIDAGLPPVRAALQAIEEFGRYDQIVPAYQAELAAAQGRRTVLWLATALPVMHLLAPLMWWHAPWSGQPPHSDHWSIATKYDYLSVAASGVALILVAGFMWGSRLLPDQVRFAKAIGVGTLLFLAVHGAAGTAVYAMSVWQWPTAAMWPPVLIGVPANVAAFGYAAFTAWRCVKACDGAATGELVAA